MQTIHFTMADLGRIRMATTVGITGEAVFAMDSFAKARTGIFAVWRRRFAHRSPVRALGRSVRPVPDLLWLVHETTLPGRAPVDGADAGRDEVVAAVRSFCSVAISPFWPRVHGHLESERDARSRLAMTGGVERLLDTLHPLVRWRPPVLEIPGERTGEIHLDGRGLVLVPSLFLHEGRAALLMDGQDGETPVLVFSAAPPSHTDAKEMWNAPEIGHRALAALVGRTRAAVLQELTDSRSTGELAERLRMSSAGISQHTSILREAGLITTRRNRNTVQHDVTRLGKALLDGTALDVRCRTS
ncbi:ArsR/SmtB family transcription factor [Amycolatopsis sp. CA-126428]|uniref:ArsR/SmtB family transcription factor n=1 Tax=Amycolatopsis sp. CA-126428 TaxID=2073158 RepID=UPI001304D365|nr:winged helix-turn-helix domain-containing protein [Amycolatopsis sp. CA-126428]